MIRRRLTLTLFHSSLCISDIGQEPHTPRRTARLLKLPIQRYQSVYDESFHAFSAGILGTCHRTVHKTRLHKESDRGINMFPVGEMAAGEAVEDAEILADLDVALTISACRR